MQAVESLKSPPPGGFDPFEATIGLRHRDIAHMLEIIGSPLAPRANKIKAMRILTEVLPSRQQEAITLGALDILRPYLMESPGGLLINTLVCLTTLTATADIAHDLLVDVAQIVEFIAPEMDYPLRREAAALLRRIAELTKADSHFMAGSVPAQMVAAVASYESLPEFLLEAYGLLSQLANKPPIRDQLISSSDFLVILVRSISNPQLHDAAMNLASNLAMDQSHEAKIALIDAEMLPAIAPYLQHEDPVQRFSALSLLALLAVPKEGKQVIATDQQIPEYLLKILREDGDEKCRRAAEGVKVLVSELRIGRAILDGGVSEEPE